MKYYKCYFYYVGVADGRDICVADRYYTGDFRKVYKETYSLLRALSHCVKNQVRVEIYEWVSGGNPRYKGIMSMFPEVGIFFAVRERVHGIILKED